MNTKKDSELEAISTERVEATPTGERLTRTEVEPSPDIHATPTEAETAQPPREITATWTGARRTPEVKVTLAAAEPVLSDATISFHTSKESKDHDTHVTLTVRQLDGTMAARISNDFGEFTKHSNNGPFNLVLVNASPKNQLRSGNFTIRIDPIGNDTWVFNFFLNLGFSDGSHLSSGADGLELTDERQQQSFGIA